jgi:hypothetical protein
MNVCNPLIAVTSMLIGSGYIIPLPNSCQETVKPCCASPVPRPNRRLLVFWRVCHQPKEGPGTSWRTRTERTPLVSACTVVHDCALLVEHAVPATAEVYWPVAFLFFRCVSNMKGNPPDRAFTNLETQRGILLELIERIMRVLRDIG